MKRVILKKRIYWWRFFFDTFCIDWKPSTGQVYITNPHVTWIARLMTPCANNYRPPKARNDNQRVL